MLQYFPETVISPAFSSKTVPQLYYMGKVLPEISAYPRILHSHSSHVEISIIYHGESEYLIREKKKKIRAGDILIYNSGVVHDELSSQNAQVGNYFFAIGDLNVPGLRPNALIPDGKTPVFHVRQGFDRITALCEQMLRDVERTDEWSAVSTHYAMLALLEIIWRVIHQNEHKDEQGGGAPLGQRIKAYIDQHYTEALSLESIGRAMRLSESYISHVFKDMMGYSPMQYVMRRRLGEAQTLLIATDYSITKIAQMVGYDSQSHFNQRFSQYVGISPGRFRRNYKERDTRGKDGAQEKAEP